MLVYPGRFQPIHMGHVDVLRDALGTHTDILIGIVVKPVNFDNPFSYVERALMIRAAVQDYGLDWRRLVVTPLFGPNVVENEINKRTLPPTRQWLIGGHETQRIARYRSLGETVIEFSQPRVHPSGTAIRTAIASSHGWAKLVSPGVASLLTSFDAPERLSALLHPHDSTDAASSVLGEATSLLRRTYQDLAADFQARGDSSRANDILQDLEHVTLVREWVLRLDRDARAELQLAALFHDIERAYRIIRRSDYETHMAYKMAHAREGAAIAARLLSAVPGIGGFSLDRVSYLISYHEDEGEGADLQTLRDADAIAFLLGDTEYYRERKSVDILEKKIAYSMERLSARGRSALIAEVTARPELVAAPVILRLAHEPPQA